MSSRAVHLINSNVRMQLVHGTKQSDCTMQQQEVIGTFKITIDHIPSDELYTTIAARRQKFNFSLFQTIDFCVDVKVQQCCQNYTKALLPLVICLQMPNFW